MATFVPLALDLGKTHCRARVTVAGQPFSETGPGAPGLADRDGVQVAVEAVLRLVAALPAEVADRVDGLGVGAAGVDADRAAAETFARLLAHRLGAPVAVASDVVTAHVGALQTAPGTVLVTGTGAVACLIRADARMVRADGWGPLLGDEGSGRWIGQAGLQHALRAYDGRGPATSLTEPAAGLRGTMEELPGYVHGSGEPSRRLAAFAPTVLSHAEAGDPVALQIVDDAVGLLTETAGVVAPPATPVCVVGGLAGSEFFIRRLHASLRRRGLRPTAPAGDALAGAATIACRTDLPHERFAIRVRPEV